MGLSHTVSEIDGDFRRKFAKFSYTRPVFCLPADRVPLWNGYRCWGQKKRNDGATKWLKKIKIGLAVETQYWCHRHGATAIAALCYASRKETSCTRPGDLDHWPFDLESGVRVTCDVGYLCANFSLPIGLSVLDLGPMWDRQTDVRQHHCSMPPPRGQDIKTFYCRCWLCIWRGCII